MYIYNRIQYWVKSSSVQIRLEMWLPEQVLLILNLSFLDEIKKVNVHRSLKENDLKLELLYQ